MKLLPALLLLVPLAAGCVNLSDAGFTAKDAMGKAEPRAHAWHADAVLVGLGAVEVSPAANASNAAFSGGFHGLPLPRDAKVGDGRAPVWALVFASPSANRTLEMLVFPNGTVLADDSRGASEDRVTGWDVDSPKAIEVAKRDPGIAAILQAPDAMLFEGLGAADNAASDPVWGFFMRSAQLHRSGRAAVGAHSGDLLAAATQNDTGDMGFAEPPKPSSFNFRGDVGPTDPTHRHPFSVEDGQTAIMMEYSVNGNLPTDGAQVKLLGPDGQQLTPRNDNNGFAGMGGSGSGSGTVQFDAKGAGTYQVVVTYDNGGAPELPVPGVQQASYTVSVQVR